MCAQLAMVSSCCCCCPPSVPCRICLLRPRACPYPGQVCWHEADQHETRPGAEIKTRPFPQDRAPTEREDREQRNSA